MGWYENIENTYLCVQRTNGVFVTDCIQIYETEHGYHDLTASMVGTDNAVIKLSISNPQGHQYDFYMVASK